MTTAPPPAQQQAAPAKKTAVDKAQSWVTLASTVAGVVGAIGTGGVWLIANFYTGTVEVRSDQPLDSVTVKVYDSRGKESTFHSKSLQLMPGTYHMEVVLPDGRSKHFDTDVKFAVTSPLQLSLQEAAASPSSAGEKGTEPGAEDPPKKKRWFQFWKKSTNKEATSSTGG